MAVLDRLLRRELGLRQPGAPTFTTDIRDRAPRPKITPSDIPLEQRRRAIFEENAARRRQALEAAGVTKQQLEHAQRVGSTRLQPQLQSGLQRGADVAKRAAGTAASALKTGLRTVGGVLSVPAAALTGAQIGGVIRDQLSEQTDSQIGRFVNTLVGTGGQALANIGRSVGLRPLERFGDQVVENAIDLERRGDAVIAGASPTRTVGEFTAASLPAPAPAPARELSSGIRRIDRPGQSPLFTNVTEGDPAQFSTLSVVPSEGGRQAIQELDARIRGAIAAGDLETAERLAVTAEQKAAVDQAYGLRRLERAAAAGVPGARRNLDLRTLREIEANKAQADLLGDLARANATVQAAGLRARDTTAKDASELSKTASEHFDKLVEQFGDDEAARAGFRTFVEASLPEIAQLNPAEQRAAIDRLRREYGLVLAYNRARRGLGNQLAETLGFRPTTLPTSTARQVTGLRSAGLGDLLATRGVGPLDVLTGGQVLELNGVPIAADEAITDEETARIVEQQLRGLRR